MVPKRSLFDVEDADPDADGDIKINKNFAKKYQDKKQKEEFTRLQAKYEASGEDSDAEDSAVGSEDEDGELITADVEAQILQTISAIRSHDPAVYDSKVCFFKGEITADAHKTSTAKPSKPLTLLDYQHKLAENGDFNKIEDEYVPLTEAQEQAKLKEAFKLALLQEDAQQDCGIILKARRKTKEDLEREDREYRDFLIKRLSKDERVKQSMPAWIDQRSADDPNEHFLIDFVLNRGWIDKSQKRQAAIDPDELEKLLQEEQEDEEHLEMTEDIECRHNFRFEQEGANTIPMFPRQIDGSLRRPDARRKDKRAEIKERKALEKQKELEQLKRLKNQRKHELLDKIKRISGASQVSELDDYVDGESDFDPDKHDRRMAALFDDQYYRQCEDAVSIASDEEADKEEELPRPLKKAVRRARKESDVKKALEDLYKLDYEDKIGDVPCRFKYMSTVPSTSFGLDIADILRADDKRLNGHVSMKKLAPYRPVDKQLEYIKKYSNKRRVWRFRHPEG